MKILSLAAAGWIVGTGVALAQGPAAPPTTRADVHFVLGWQNLNKDQPQDSTNDWVNAIAFGGAGAGWYWTDHAKTQIDVGGGTKGRQYRYRQFTLNGLQTYESSRLSVRKTSLAISQQYQFFRNAWFHPHVGAGIDLARETTTEEYQPVYVFDNALRTSRQIIPGRREGPDHRLLARPFVETGFKGYMSRRAFFTADSRVMFGRGIDEVLFRFGFGVDF